MIYGTDVKSAPLSRNVRSRWPESIIDPRVGQLKIDVTAAAGLNDMVSSPTARKTVSKAAGAKLSTLTIRRVSTWEKFV